MGGNKVDIIDYFETIKEIADSVTNFEKTAVEGYEEITQVLRDMSDADIL